MLFEGDMIVPPWGSTTPGGDNIISDVGSNPTGADKMISYL